MKASVLLVVLLACVVSGARAADRTVDAAAHPPPPMGWSSWNAFGCNIDARSIRRTADALLASGLRDAGYVYLNIDDCWQAARRDREGQLQADPARFPDGIRSLADYAHARGLKLGLYASSGSRTCANIWNEYPGRLGSLGHEALDARTFARGGVDYLKYDWCSADEDGVDAEAAFTRMHLLLGAVGRPIFYSIHREPQLPIDTWRPRIANAWRTTADIRPNWQTILRNLDQQVGLEAFSSPGHWNDPDMLEVGNGALGIEENRAHFSLWALLNAPLILGNDLTALSDAVRRIVSNRDVIAVDQDWAGTQGHKLRDDGETEVWGKPMSDGSFAVVLLDRAEQPVRVGLRAAEIGFSPDACLSVKNLWTGAEGLYRGEYADRVPAHGVSMIRVWSRPPRGNRAAQACK